MATTLKQIENCQEATNTNAMNDLLLMLYAHLIGSSIQVTVRNGTKFVGICHTIWPDGELGVVLTKAQKIPGKGEKARPPIERLVIEPKDCVDIKATDIDLWHGLSSKSSTSSPTTSDGFKTDTAISGQFGELRERTLQKWTPDGGTDFSIEDELPPARGSQQNPNGQHWNQFEVNERLFGLKTNFDEELYTTKLNRDRPDFKAREKQAIQLAREIESTASRNPHMAEERGQKYDDTGLDEEDKYSGVVRANEAMQPSTSLTVPLSAPSATTNKYMPPAMRARQQHNLAKSAEFSNVASNPPATSPAAPTTLTPVLRPRPELSNRKVETISDAANRKNDNSIRSRGSENKDIEKRVAELKAFSKEFKLLTPMPADLIPIISGGKALKQAEKEDSTKPVTTASTSSASTTKSFKFNVKACEFKPASVSAPTPGSSANSTGTSGSLDREDSFWAGDHRRYRGGNNRDWRFSGKPFKRFKGPPQPPNTVAPTWPYGNQSFRRHFQVTNHYEGSEMYPDFGGQGYGYQYGGPGYRYPNQSYLPPGQMGMQGPPPQYMNPGFIPNMPFGAPLQHGGPPHMYNNLPPGPPPPIYPKGQSPIPEQGQYYPPPPPPHSYASPPPRSGGVPMGPAGGLPPQMYNPYSNSPHSGPMMVRYPTDMMHPTMPPNGMTMPPPGASPQE